MGLDPTDFYVELQEQRSLQACARIFKDAIACSGFTVFACGELDFDDLDRNVMYIAEWPEAWRRFYFEQGFIHRDPVVNALDVYRRPFTFREGMGDRRFLSGDKDLLRAAAEHGWSRGLVVPVPRGGSRFGLVSLVGAGPDIEAADRARLTLMSECLLARVRTLVQAGEDEFALTSLTRREIEALRLVAGGCSDAEIAARLGISRSTAHRHVEGARKRLKAKSRAEMAAIAVSLALAPAVVPQK